MKISVFVILVPLFFTLSVWSATPVPYSGKIDIGGVNYYGEAQFAFSLHDGNGTTHWRNGKQPGETLKVGIRNGRYNVLLGGQGMTSLAPQLFLNHDKLYLKVEVDMGDGKGLRHLAPDQLITATPRALVADIAKVAEVAKVAKVAEKVGNGAITRGMLSQEVLSQLDANATSSPTVPITITRDMLPASVLNDLNKSVSITRDMLPQDVRDDLNKSVTVTRSMLPTDVLSDLNATIGMNRLSAEVTGKLERNATLADGSITGNKLGNKTIGKDQISDEILKYLKPEITVHPQAQTVYADSNVSFSVTAEGKYLTYQWKKNETSLTGETNATFTITDANATNHDGNYSVIVSNDFGSVESGIVEVKVSDAIMNGLVGWWKFDETNGTVAYDSSGNGNDGNLTNGPTFVSGKIGGALSFDGVDDVMTAPLPNLNTSNISISQSAWIKTDSSKVELVISTKRININYGWPTVMLKRGKGSIEMDKSGSRESFTGTQAINDNAWHFICGVKNQNNYLIYVDGSLSKSGTSTSSYSATDSIWIGSHGAGGGWDSSDFNGLIDDVRVYDRALSAEEVQALYNLRQ